ncbi:MAG: amidohydrolase family protein [Ignavibacteria bacterium]|nr:amidohydrolase family protein [Ignavibacteria bacterium]
MILRNLKLVGGIEKAKDIKVENGFISEVNSSGSLTDDVEIYFEDCIAFPGLINSHDHLEFNLYPQLGHKIYDDYIEWGIDIHSKDKEIIKSIEAIPVDLRVQYGIIKNLICGVTTVAHHGACNSCPDDSPVDIIQNTTSIHSVRLGGKWKLKLNWIRNLQPYVIHIGEGLTKESYDEIDEFIRWNLFKRKVIGIHGIAMTEEQSKNFEALIWCPVSNQFLFNKTADISSLKKTTKILFGTDSTLTAGWNIWDHLRKARELALLSDEELFSSVTDKAAGVWGLKHKGKISEGKIADMVIVKNKSNNLFNSFYKTDPEDILLILKNGRIVLFDESVKGILSFITDELERFAEVMLNGKVKFVNFDVTGILKELRKHGLRVFPGYEMLA